jgi:hypothetical protein
MKDKPVRAARKTPCLVCGGTSWPCSYLPDGSIRFCGKVRSDKPDSLGETWLHFANDSRAYSPPVRVVKPSSSPVPQVASVAHRHKVYSALLDFLTLSAHRRDNLLERGLTPALIEANWYKDTPTTDESDALAESLAHLGLEGVAGFFFMRGAWRLRWCRPAGFFVPYRDFDGRIRGMMWRFDEPVGKAKYRWLSSDPEDVDDRGNVKFPMGASSHAPLNFARPDLISTSPDIWLTEGSLKSEVAAHLLNVPFIAAGGVSQWGSDFGERFKQRFPEHRAVIAFDRDWHTGRDGKPNPQVKRSLERLMSQLDVARVRYIIRSWSRPEKGIDDLALALSQPKQRRVA